MTLRAVLFDVGETLWHTPAAPPAEDFRRWAAEAATRQLAEWVIECPDPALAARAAWASVEDAMAAARVSDLREPHYATVARDALAANAGLQLTVAQAEAFLEAIYVSGADAGKVAYPGAAETLLRLKSAGLLLATATNRVFGGARFRCDLRVCGIDPGWDAHSISAEVGYLKPHPAVFEHALEQLGVAPGEALMVGNSLKEDIAGAARLGIPTAWFRCKPDAQDIHPDWTIDSVPELLELPPIREVLGG
ncbi:MAG: HAD-IA family hydrolase [Dehalococcoidia bacterium]|nr:HAD-IA family hydrolase [Dehalococcoidia bacterium]